MNNLMKFNMNDTVFVKLTSYGQEVISKENQKISIELKQTYDLMKYKEVQNGYSKWTLWELMNVFGNYLYNGSEVCFENNEICFQDKNI